jgi:hypothetical protein
MADRRRDCLSWFAQRDLPEPCPLFVYSGLSRRLELTVEGDEIKGTLTSGERKADGVAKKRKSEELNRRAVV